MPQSVAWDGTIVSGVGKVSNSPHKSETYPLELRSCVIPHFTTIISLTPLLFLLFMLPS